jgi:hypothetical protein
VVVNAEWALTHAAGGQFEVFPNWLRVLYICNLFFLLYQLLVFGWLKNGIPVKPNWMPRFLIAINLLGMILNLISRSPYERFNAIGLAIVAISFWKFN